MIDDVQIYLGVALAGLVSFLSPCVLPLVPSYLGYIGGTTVEEMTARGEGSDRVWRRVVASAVAFVLGFTTVFVALGATASLAGQFIQTYRAELAFVAGVVIILFGLHFLGVLRIPFLYADKRARVDMPEASYLGAYLIGLAFAFGWTPCIGPILATVLAVAANEATLGAGVSLLAAYSLGLGVPFVAAAMAVGPFLSFMQRFRRHLGVVEKAMGVVLILTGVLFLTGWINGLGPWLIETFPALANIEEWVSSDALRDGLAKKASGQ